MEGEFKDRVVWVTGGSSGLGRAMVRAFARRGARVAWNHWGDPTGDAEQRHWCETNGVEFLADEVNVTDEAGIEAFVEKLIQRWGRMDVLVANAGIRDDAVSWKMSLDAWRRVIEVNLTGAFICARAVIPPMRAQGQGRIIMTSSINALRGKFGLSNYAASKAGMIGLVRSLARETARFGITVNAIAPGLVHTPLTRTLPPDILEQARREAILGYMPEPDDIAAAVIFLASDAARCITGEVLRIDSGQWLASGL